MATIANVYDAFDLEKFANHVARVAYERDKVMDWMGIVRDMRDANQSNIPVLQTRTGTEVTPLQDRTEGSGVTEKSKRLTQYNSIEATDVLPWEQTLKIPWPMQRHYAERVGGAVAQAKLNRFVRFMIGSVSQSSPDNLLSADIEGYTADAVRDMLAKATEIFDDLNTPEGPENRVAMLAPKAFNQIYTTASIVRKDFGGMGGVGRFPQMYEYAGFTLVNVSTGFNSATLPGAEAKTPGKYRVDTANFSATGKGVYGFAFATETLAQGYATDGELDRITVMPPAFIPEKKGWMLNAALIWDVVCMHESAATGHAGTFTTNSPDTDPGTATHVVVFEDSN